MGPDRGPGVEGGKEDSGVWTAQERKDSITLRELRAVTLVLGEEIGADVQASEVKRRQPRWSG